MSKTYDQIKFSFTEGAPENETFPNAYGFMIKLQYEGKTIKLPYYMGSGHKDPIPEKKDVIDCIVNDAMAFKDAKDILDFASEFGYSLETSKEKANVRKTFEACNQIYVKLYNTLGKTGFEDLVDDINELRENE